eukprot:CAMPEP_0177658798 /NCGR_PEP_ID=MMETSP0447-20121125/17059_1 /TAXON_ID=0 /ORGANISM="Stygamoeba regulata, Strain BSH-02190019" /LENGTH=259 /DNA_ID=CAMNT_0019163541 /DNA_START=88 /DNA_END=864 /DNA_ORIENTATION=-
MEALDVAHDFLQDKYILLRETYPCSDAWFFALSIFVIHNACFIPLNLLCHVMWANDLFPKYKIQKGATPDAALVKKALIEQVINQLFVTGPILYWIIYPTLTKYGGLHFSDELPSFSTAALHVFGCMVMEDCLFYWAHRTLHHPRIYKYIHKKHHEFKVTIGLASEYAHPVEVFFANLIPTLSGAMVFNVHITTLWVWLIIRVWETIDAHCGYALPFSPWNMLPFQGGSERHDYHHSHNMGSFGSYFNIWDRVCGTDKP